MGRPARVAGRDGGAHRAGLRADQPTVRGAGEERRRHPGADRVGRRRAAHRAAERPAHRAGPGRRGGRRHAVDRRAERAAVGQGRLRDRADAGRLRRDRRRLRGRGGRPARGRPARPWRTLGRGRVRVARQARGQRGGLRHHRRGRRSREHAALDSQRRRLDPRRPVAARRRCRARQPVHRRHHPYPAGGRTVHPGPAQGVRRGARGPRGRHGGGQAGGQVLRRARRGDPGDRRAPARVGAAAGVCRADAGPRARGPPPALDGARNVPPLGHRRARLRAGAARELPRRRAAARHGDHRRTGPVLQVDRPAGARRTARHRGAHRRRRADHRDRLREPLGAAAAHRRGRRKLDGRATRTPLNIGLPWAAVLVRRHSDDGSQQLGLRARTAPWPRHQKDAPRTHLVALRRRPPVPLGGARRGGGGGPAR
ncbi:putative Uncharacterized 50.6 kDa protein in the 5'region of gyrA and gyrB [Micropruina glycogenica]|uniref:Putative Uncharacterized 50.6 kDa protein in the 5'region of gyrA and gyrB n=1 Tax=Micropruina glycogenica TaxID=75385 RepID=A0A2N9JJB5_9ACTN|nr:putative Uncharacterized 50.6 kDa protein in the 5'region of gyrA and gyrB [Micropruina glycogenica]